MRLLITGNCSQIGQSLTDMLLDAGHTVVGYDRLSPVATRKRFEQVRGDVRVLDDLEAAAEDCEAGIHLAALANDAGAADMLSVNLVGLYTFLEVAGKGSFGTTVVAGSAPVHLPPGEFDTGIGTPPQEADLYDLSKYFQELMARRFHADGLPITCLRFGHVVRGATGTTLEDGMPLGELDYCRGGWVDLDDVAAGCVSALASKPDDDFRIYNIVGSRSARERFDVRATEKRFGFELQYDFAGYR